MSEAESFDPDRRELLMKTLLGGFIAASVAGKPADAGSHLRAKDFEYPPSEPQLFAEINAVLAHTEEIWNAQEWWRLPEEIWDREDPSPIYVAEELYDVMVGWPVLEQIYFPAKKRPRCFPLGLFEIIREGAGAGCGPGAL